MARIMQYVSTNQQAEAVSFRGALLGGQAPDRGLYFPEAIPTIPEARRKEWKQCDYPTIATDILSAFIQDDIPTEVIRRICEDAYNFEVPIETVTDNRYVMRLDQGPTASFKDFAARAMARLMSHFLQDEQRELVILTATSGDTGSAIAHAFYQVPGIRVVILFPKDEVSDRQRKQMTTLGQNISVLAVDGKFDDCQAMVKQAFADQALSTLPLTSANSINIGRLVPQSVYYAYAHSRLVEANEPLLFSIPCGNFGNMMGAMLARKMGVPIGPLVIAVNENDEVPTFLASGAYNKIEPSRNCLSNAMNVGHPSNLARLIHMYNGQMDHTGAIGRQPNMEEMNNELFSYSISDQETRDTIVAAHKEHGLLLEPHGAVGWAGLKHYFAAHPEAASQPAVSVETAHPAKFPQAIEELLQLTPDIPPSLASIEQKTEQYETIDNSYQQFAAYLLASL
jgi:threonine synthase